MKEKINELKLCASFLNQAAAEKITINEILEKIGEFGNVFEVEKEEMMQCAFKQAMSKVQEEKESLLHRIRNLEQEAEDLKYSKKLYQ